MKMLPLPSVIAIALTVLTTYATPTDDPFSWLESVDSEKALNWVRSHNKPTVEHLSNQEGFAAKKEAALEILTASDRIIYGSLRNGWVYNFWQSAEQPQGVWRRTPYQNFKSQNYEWEVLIDLDKMSKEDGINWVWKEVEQLNPTSPLALVQLSDGGKDAVTVREFNIESKSFVEDGFFIPEAKTHVTWASEDAIWIATKFDEDAVTESGYPRILKYLKRGQAIENAETVYVGDKSHVFVRPSVIKHSGKKYELLIDTPAFFQSETYLIQPNKELLKLPIRLSDSLETIFKDQCIVQTRKSWKIHGQLIKAGSLVAFDLTDFQTNETIDSVKVLFSPTPKTAIKSVYPSKDAIILNTNNNVTSQITQIEFDGKNWKSTPVDLPKNGSIAINSANPNETIVYLSYENFLTPNSLIELDTQTSEWEKIQSLPERFDASNLTIEQYHATSNDGTEIPYFIVHSKDMKLNGKNPTYLYGYGGFEISLNPRYQSTTGKLWLEPGNVYVLANIRGGGEFGPTWHQAALKLNRQKAYDDFHSIAQDLIDRNITSPEHLGIGGGSNGGLLVGVAFTQKPKLYNAVFCAVPLLDMLRYHELPPGASWISEYGDPRIPEERAAIAAYSPYQNLKQSKKYPKVFFYTSTRDDRVHPAHARKTAAKMESQGHPFHYFERIEGGHAGGANLSQYAELYALQFTYLENQLKAKTKE